MRPDLVRKLAANGDEIVLSHRTGTVLMVAFAVGHPSSQVPALLGFFPFQKCIGAQQRHTRLSLARLAIGTGSTGCFP